MVSGYDKRPPEPEYSPRVGLAGRIAVVGLLIVAALAGVGWWFV